MMGLLVLWMDVSRLLHPVALRCIVISVLHA